MTMLYKFLQKTSLAAWLLFLFMTVAFCVTLILFAVYHKKNAHKNDSGVITITQSIQVLDKISTLIVDRQNIDAEELLFLQEQIHNLSETIAVCEKNTVSLQKENARLKTRIQALRKKAQPLPDTKEVADDTPITTTDTATNDSIADTNTAFVEKAKKVIVTLRNSEAQLRSDIDQAADKLRDARDSDSVEFLQNSIQESLREIRVALENSINRRA